MARRARAPAGRDVPRLSRTVEIAAAPATVFAYLDDIRRVGEQMARGSLMLLGGRFTLEIVSPAPTGVGARYRWRGRILGVRLDFSEVVIEWVPPQRKRWRMVRGARILVLAGYELGFVIESSAGGSAVTLDIEYELPRSGLARLLGRLLARPYSAWCLRSMIDRNQAHFRHQPDGGRAMSWLRSPWVVLVGFMGIAAFFLFTEDRACAFGAVPYLLLLACPLLHFLMSDGYDRQDGRRGGDHDSRGHASDTRPPDSDASRGRVQP